MGDFSCLVDLKGDYFVIAIHPDHQKCFTFNLGELFIDPEYEGGGEVHHHGHAQLRVEPQPLYLHEGNVGACQRSPFSGSATPSIP